VKHFLGKNGKSVGQHFTLDVPKLFNHFFFDCTQQSFVSAAPGKAIKSRQGRQTGAPKQAL
jgi:hypothetical protein